MADFNQYVKTMVKDNPEWEPVYVIKASPKPKSVKEMLKAMGMKTQLRGVGFTRKSKEQSKKARKTAKASRRKNR